MGAFSGWENTCESAVKRTSVAGVTNSASSKDLVTARLHKRNGGMFGSTLVVEEAARLEEEGFESSEAVECHLYHSSLIRCAWAVRTPQRLRKVLGGM